MSSSFHARASAWPRWSAARAFAALLVAGCVAPLADPAEPLAEPLALGASRDVELRFLRFDVRNFEQTLSRQELLDLPADTQERLWLLDLDLRAGPNTPRLLDNALVAIRDLDPETLTPASRNLQQLLRMTPDTAELSGTALEELLELAPLLGLSPARVLADLLGTDVEDPILSAAVVSDAVLRQVIGTHPNAQTRLGPRTLGNPEGVYAVTPGTLPLTLADAASDFATLSARFGPVVRDGVYHPGFIVGDTRARVFEDDFSLTVRANVNALPFKGVELRNATEASVGSVRSQIDALFDFEDPRWLTIEGLRPGEPLIEELTFRIIEHDGFVRGGRSPVPAGTGSSEGWTLPAYTLERVLLEGARDAFSSQSAFVSYTQPGRTEPLFSAEVALGWQRIDVLGGVGSPPPPSYLWDLILEVGQVRLRDEGVPEGEGDVEFTLKDVPVGTDSSLIERSLRENLAAEPRALLDIANRLIDTTQGEADFYYVRVEGDGDDDGDWLFYLAPGDIPRDDAGEPVRPYEVEAPGFYADEALSEPLSDRREVAGDVEHAKVRVAPGDVLYAPGPGGAVYRLEVRDKPGASRVALTVTRVR